MAERQQTAVLKALKNGPPVAGGPFFVGDQAPKPPSMVRLAPVI